MKINVIVCSIYNNIWKKIKLKDDEIVEQVEDFIYFTISSDGRCKKEIENMPS